ncbi:hypothetical protein DyAD56_23535 [Dyella sp. AD56]|nr:hypothetical protein DyAD56_23535 [Dyella sp. AD56]
MIRIAVNRFLRKQLGCVFVSQFDIAIVVRDIEREIALGPHLQCIERCHVHARQHQFAAWHVLAQKHRLEQRRMAGCPTLRSDCVDNSLERQVLVPIRSQSRSSDLARKTRECFRIMQTEA